MIHPTAIIHPGAKLADDVEVGPYAVIGEHVSIGEGSTVGPHAVVEGWTRIGTENKIFQFASVGGAPQDLKYAGEETHLTIGDRNTIREFTTFSLGTPGGGGETCVGNDNLFMAYTHVAHDCVIGNNVVMANGATLAGHVSIGDYAILGGLCAIHQFCNIGSHCMISGGAMVVQDLVPYSISQGDRAEVVGVNSIGLKRRGFPGETLRAIKEAYKLIFRSGMRLEEALIKIEDELAPSQELDVLVQFIKKSERGIAR